MPAKIMKMSEIKKKNGLFLSYSQMSHKTLRNPIYIKVCGMLKCLLALKNTIFRLLVLIFENANLSRMKRQIQKIVC